MALFLGPSDAGAGNTPMVDSPISTTFKTTNDAVSEKNRMLFVQEKRQHDGSTGCGCNCGSGGGDESNDSNEVNALISEEMKNLSLEQRERLFEDIHGVADTEQMDTSIDVERKLEGMQTAINWIKVKPAYDRARFLNPTTVYDRNLRLAMLRSSDYDEIKAARRLVQHFQFKMKLFGLDLLAKRQIEQDDLTPMAQKRLREGTYQMLPYKDRMGRVLFFATTNSGDGDWQSHFSMLWYNSMRVFLDDEDVQKRGMACIVYNFGAKKEEESSQKSYISPLRDFEAAMPTRSAVYHFLYDDPRMKFLLNLIQLALTNSHHRLRFRAHYGSPLECMYRLMSYGISPEMLPFGQDGFINVEENNRRLDAVRDDEREYSKQYRALTPNSCDVVLGRGYPFQSFVGNRFVTAIAYRNHDLYAKLPRNKKTVMTLGIVNYVMEERGCRFLKRSTDDYKSPQPLVVNAKSMPQAHIWTVAPLEEAKHKVGHLLRATVKSDALEIIKHGWEMRKTDQGSIEFFVPRSCPKPTECSSH